MKIILMVIHHKEESLGFKMPDRSSKYRGDSQQILADHITTCLKGTVPYIRRIPRFERKNNND